MLTAKQRELLLFIDNRLKRERHFPELRRDARSARAQVQVGRSPADLGARGARVHPPAAQPGARARGAEAARDASPRRSYRCDRQLPPPANDTIDIPLHGRIAAGTPIEALQGTETFSVPAALARPRRTLCARSVGQFDGRRRHSRRRFRADPQGRHRPRRRDRRRPDRRRGSDPQDLSAARAG